MLWCRESFTARFCLFKLVVISFGVSPVGVARLILIDINWIPTRLHS